ncbi:MAG: sugar-transfer associated ATP-grasp domain-containing protein [Myxococcaceae bacterium]
MSLLASARAFLAELRRRRDELVGINQRNVMLVYPNNPRRHYPIADDKLIAKEHFLRAGVPTPATLEICEGLFAVRDTVAKLAGRSHLVVKPANGSGGAGIVVLGDCESDGRWLKPGGQRVGPAELEKHLADIVFGAYSNSLDDRAFVEERVFPHPFFSELWPDGLCDVRIITLQGRALMSMVRVPTRESEGRANLHQGGLGIAVDLETGVTTRALHRGKAIDRHPETGAPLLGREVPRWAEVLEVALKTARAVPLGYLGVDVVVDRAKGPLVLEINVRPGLEIQNVNGRGLGVALGEAAA